MIFDVFISYSTKDAIAAKATCAALEAAKIRCWMAPRDIVPGVRWGASIVRAINQCRVMVLIFSGNANSSAQVQREVDQAFSKGKAVLPLRIEDVKPVDELAYYLDTVHWLDALTPPLERNLERLVAAVQALLPTAEPAPGDGPAIDDRDARAQDEARAEDEKREQAVQSEQRAEAAIKRKTQAAEEQTKREEADAQRLEEEQRRRDAEEKARAKETAELLERERAEEEARQRRAAEQQRTKAEQQSAEDERRRNEAQAKRAAVAEEHSRLRRSQAWPLWPLSRPALLIGSLSVAVIGAIAFWAIGSSQLDPLTTMPITVSALSLEQERALKPKDTFKECSICPEVIVVPAGSFTMGSPASESGRHIYEGPQHKVTFPKQFAVGKFALTFAEWDACVADSGCNGHRPVDEGWGRGRQPVINVSWDDAKTYVVWLSKKTGKVYRLLSEAEREYVTRAGTTTAYWWGNSISTDQANYKYFRRRTVAVDSFVPNPWGFYQVHGNVVDWLEDCWHDSYNGAPANGSAWTSGDCSGRIVRGGTWTNDPDRLRAAARDGNTATGTAGRFSSFGFRVARTILAP
jgi:formylglycine-generating enzyme required for sulfatase activity